MQLFIRRRRLWGRLENYTQVGSTQMLTHLDANLWHGFSESGNATFNAFPFAIGSESTSLEWKAGAAFHSSGTRRPASLPMLTTPSISPAATITVLTTRSPALRGGLHADPKSGAYPNPQIGSAGEGDRQKRAPSQSTHQDHALTLPPRGADYVSVEGTRHA